MRSEFSASIGLVIGGALWGLIWLPLRYLEGIGLPGAWSGLALYVGAAVVILPFWLSGRFGVTASLRSLAICGLFLGGAFSLYASSLLLTDVVRALLLFYLTPIWGTALGVFVLGEALTRTRVIALLMAMGGLLVVLGIGETAPLPRNAGDWLALLSGMCWAIGSLKIYQLGSANTFEQIVAFVFGSLVVTLAVMVIAPDVFVAGTSLITALPALPWGILMSLYVLPMLVLTVWPASLLTPGRVGILLMSDLLVGVISAALFAGEPFGWREAVGSLLIIGAAVVEVLGKRPTV
ncbi:DMT family transporter [uncultured Tateyamaria sp.]|uniref:DMT family transporter n=1 Tax=uncultured Tateyamaria sp. TaxID=455651 RepID=UPI00260FA57F|nr:DMT family transporter [uncultured Tateyamaria sp.]